MSNILAFRVKLAPQAKPKSRRRKRRRWISNLPPHQGEALRDLSDTYFNEFALGKPTLEMDEIEFLFAMSNQAEPPNQAQRRRLAAMRFRIQKFSQ